MAYFTHYRARRNWFLNSRKMARTGRWYPRLLLKPHRVVPDWRMRQIMRRRSRPRHDLMVSFWTVDWITP